MPTAAYCTECRAYVFTTDDGMCANGHGRPQLRNIYEAGIDRRSGNPQPPKRSAGRPTITRYAPVEEGISHIPPLREPRATVPHVWCDVEGGPYEERGPFARMFSRPRGRHSSSVSVTLEFGNPAAFAMLALALIATAIVIGYVAGAGISAASSDLPSLLAIAP